MITRQVKTGDMSLVINDRGKKTVRFTETVSEYVLEKLQVLFRFELAEWFADRRQGLPYKKRIFQGASDVEIRGIFMKVLKLLPEVTRVVRLDITRDKQTRTVNIGFQLVLSDGSLVEILPADRRFVVDTSPNFEVK